jgi:hypothetical protein
VPENGGASLPRTGNARNQRFPRSGGRGQPCALPVWIGLGGRSLPSAAAVSEGNRCFWVVSARNFSATRDRNQRLVAAGCAWMGVRRWSVSDRRPVIGPWESPKRRLSTPELTPGSSRRGRAQRVLLPITLYPLAAQVAECGAHNPLLQRRRWVPATTPWDKAAARVDDGWVVCCRSSHHKVHKRCVLALERAPVQASPGIESEHLLGEPNDRTGRSLPKRNDRLHHTHARSGEAR